jgi:plasmid stabilization system protein ParE
MSAKSVQYHEGATQDIKNAVAWYQKHSAKAALDFIEELHRATTTIFEAPDRWPLGPNSSRRFLLWRFPFCLIYSEQESVITIWAVAHGSRQPGYWAERVK